MKRGYVVALVVLIGAVLAGESLRADEVVIENRGKQTFYYSLRERDGEMWSRTYEVAAGEQRTHATSERLRISYLTSSAQFEWLEPRSTYRIDDVAEGRLRAVTVVRRPTTPAASPETANGAPATGQTAELPAPASPGPAATAAPDRAAEPAEAEFATPIPSPAGEAPAPSPAAEAPALPPAAGADRVDETFEGLFDIANRIVTVRAIADNTYRAAIPEWRERAKRIVAGASEYYQREYAIRLVLTETKEWEYDGVSADLETRWAELLEQSPREIDLIVALVGYGDYSSVKGEAAYTGQLGRAAFFGQHLMVADRKDYHENRAKTVLIHELGHVFGAFHVADQNLMMYPGYLQLPTDDIIAGTVAFGEINDAVFAMTKGFDFRAGVNSLSLETQRKIQQLYRQHGLPQEARQTDPITAGYTYREQRAKIVAQQMAERARDARGAFDVLPE